MTATTRAQVRDGIAQFFGGTTWDATGRIYRPTPLAAYGLAGVRPYMGKRLPADSDFTHGLPQGRAMGAVMLVHLPSDTETRDSFGGPLSGIKQDRITVQLYLYHRAQVPHAEDAQADLEELLQAIRDRIHSDRTLGGTVVQAGEGQGGYITTDMDVPVVGRNDATESTARVSFNADLYPAA